MKIIAHRGNLNGPDPARENTIEQAEKCFALGFDVELDAWHIDGNMFLGHDEPNTKIDPMWILRPNHKLWLHWKNTDGLLWAMYGFEFLLNPIFSNYFMHDNEPFVETTSGAYWLYPGTPITDDMLSAPAIVACLPELAPDWDTSQATHICTDYPIMYREKYMRTVSQ